MAKGSGQRRRPALRKQVLRAMSATPHPSLERMACNDNADGKSTQAVYLWHVAARCRCAAQGAYCF